MSSKQAVRVLFKELAHHAKRLDRHPAVKALISPFKRPEMLAPYLGKSGKLYLPPMSYMQVLRNAFREPLARPEDFGARLGVGFAAIRFVTAQLASILDTCPELLAESAAMTSDNMRESTKFKLAKELKPGTLLLAHPLLQGIFRHAVIMITSYSIEHGTEGLILNHLYDYRGTNRAEGILYDEEVKKAFEQFGGKPVWLGGPVLYSEDTLRNLAMAASRKMPVSSHAIHKWPSVPGSSPLGNGLYLGGKWDLIGEWGAKKRQDARLFVGRSAWSPGQLENELKNNVWVTVTPMDDFLFEEPEDPDDESDLMQMPIPIPLADQLLEEEEDPRTKQYGRIIRPPYSISNPGPARTPVRKPRESPEKMAAEPEPPKVHPAFQPHDMWREIMTQLGGEYAQFAEIPRNLPGPEEPDADED